MAQLAAKQPAAPEAKGNLVIFVPDTEPITFELMPGITTIGRGIENHLVLGDPYASRKHGVITCKSGSFTFEDTGSDNGTLINGNRGTGGARPLQTGDVIEIGSVLMRFVQGQIQPPHYSPPAPSGAGVVSPRRAKRGKGKKTQLYLLIVLVVLTLGMIGAMVVILMNR
jgi:pSer/pThr/pTyr-binding forkhead associated (FHA) protein